MKQRNIQLTRDFYTAIDSVTISLSAKFQATENRQLNQTCECSDIQSDNVQSSKSRKLQFSIFHTSKRDHQWLGVGNLHSCLRRMQSQTAQESKEKRSDEVSVPHDRSDRSSQRMDVTAWNDKKNLNRLMFMNIN